MTLNLTKLILEAQKYLVCKPFDLAHDITHHYRVYQWCLKIVEAENLEVNTNILTVAAWWHDAEERTGKIVSAVEKSLEKNEVDPRFIDEVINVIRKHSLGKKQTSPEAKVLFDADKLEYVSPQRLAWFAQAASDGFINEKTYIRYHKDWRQRTPKIPSLLHFKFSKKEYKRMYKSIRKNSKRYWSSTGIKT